MSRQLTIHAADGYPLGAERHDPPGPERGHIVMAGAAAVPQGFYRRFAEYAATLGYTVTTFDYRGVGRSAPPTLRGFDADFLDWGQLDLAAVVRACAGGGVPLLLVGHSFAGNAFGMLPNHHLVDAVYLFGTGTGWHGFMPPPEQWRVRFLWHVLAPLLVRRHGYLAWRRFGLGEDLPLGVYRQWKRWCRRPRFLLDDPGLTSVALNFAHVTTPIMAVNAIDDRWAPPVSRDAFMSGYSGAPWRGADIDHLALGHMGYFRERGRPLWDAALEWFERLPTRTRLSVD